MYNILISVFAIFAEHESNGPNHEDNKIEIGIVLDAADYLAVQNITDHSEVFSKRNNYRKKFKITANEFNVF